jgi:hypothetical protein
MTIDINKLEARAARHPSQHVKRFEPLIRGLIEAVVNTGRKVDKHYTNQIKIDDRWIGKFEHRTHTHPSRITITDSRSGMIEVAIHNQAEARVFAETIRWKK